MNVARVSCPALFLFLCSFVFLFSSCSSVKRYRSAAYKGEDPGLVQLELSSSRLQPPAGIRENQSLWTLSANAQTRLVQILDQRFPDNHDFIGRLNSSYGQIEYAPLTDMNHRDLQLVFTVRRQKDFSLLNDKSGHFSPADRIEELRITLELPPEYGLSFRTWNRYVTEYGELEIADVSFSRNLALGADTDPGPVDADASWSVGRNEKQQITRRYLKLNGSLSEHILTLEEEGNREIDLTGNILADVSLQFEAFPEVVILPQFTGTEGAAGELAGLSIQHLAVPAMEELPDTLKAQMRMSYVYRHVQSGSKTYAESDDRVEYYSGDLVREVPLFVKEDLNPGFYGIVSEGNGEFLRLSLKPGEVYLLQFINYRDAAMFRQWLNAQSDLDMLPGFSGSASLHMAGEPLNLKGLKDQTLKVKSVY